MLHYCTSQVNNKAGVRLVLTMQINQACVALKPWRCWAAPGQEEILDAHHLSASTYQNVLNPLSAHTSEQGSGDLSHQPPFHTRGTQIFIILGALWEEKALCRSKSTHPHMNQIQSSFLRPSQAIYDLLSSSPPREKHTIRASQEPIEVTGLWRRSLTPTITVYMWLLYFIQRGALEISHRTGAKASDSHFNWALIHLSSVKGFRISIEE